MAEYYLAVDIGASSGRHILGHLEDGRIVLEEVYRFENGMEKKDGHLCWNLPRLFHEIKEGLKACRAAGKIPKSMGIDTWAVDYVLLDGEDRILGNTYGYRDGRTKGMDKEVYKIIPEDALYARTGIQKQMFNTIYQLMAVKTQEPENMEKAEWLLMLPDYFHFLLTGNKLSEYTNATSTQLVSPETKQWDYELIERLGYKPSVFRPLHMPGTVVGPFSKEVEEEVGFTCEVVMPATHDTASAVISVPALTDDCLYISSGTWSLMGIENDKAICSPESRKRNFTNEGGYEYRFRYLKNIMGLWMIQSVKKESAPVLGFGEICALASKEAITSYVDVNDARFLAPENMTEEVKKACEESGQQIPQTIGELAAVIYHSLAECYAKTVEEIEALTGITYPKIQIVGGGANAQYLNELTAKYTGKDVCAGPTEATAVGNLAAQMIAAGELRDLKAARACIAESFEMNMFRSGQERRFI